MSDNRNNAGEKWKAFKPSKTLWFWSSVGVMIATIAVGFGYGGWVTGGTAQQMAEDAAEKARARLVADVCVQRYISGKQFASRLADLKEANTWKREDLIEKGKWTQLPGIKQSVDDAAELCARELAGMNVPNNPAKSSGGTGETTG